MLSPVFPAGAASNVAILSEETPPGQQMRQLLQDGLRASGLREVAWSGDRPVERVDILVAIGLTSLRQALQMDSGRPVVGVMVTRASLEAELARLPQKSDRRVSLHALVLDQPPGRYFDLIRLAFPQRRQIGFLSGESGDASLRWLEKSAQARGMTLSIGRIQEEFSFIARLERVLSQSEVFLALPDNAVHNRNTVQPLLLTTYRAGIPVVAYSHAYVQAGALLGLYSTPAQLARQTVALVHDLAQGRGGGQAGVRIQVPKDFTVSVNTTVARSLGILLPSGDSLAESLRKLAPAEVGAE